MGRLNVGVVAYVHLCDTTSWDATVSVAPGTRITNARASRVLKESAAVVLG